MIADTSNQTSCTESWSFEITDASVYFKVGTYECHVPIVSRITIRISSRDAQRTEDDKNGKKNDFHTLNISGANRPVLCGIFPGNNTQIVALNKSRGVIRFRGRFIQRLVSGDVH
jgi:hypothetical protein